MALRDVPTYGAYMAMYEMCLDGLPGARDTLVGGLIAGGIAGCGSWSMAVPADVVKSRLQSCTAVTGAGVGGSISEAVGVSQCVRRVYAEAGIAGFFTGWTVTVCRSFPVNAVTLVIYSYSLKCMRGDEEIDWISSNIPCTIICNSSRYLYTNHYTTNHAHYSQVYTMLYRLYFVRMWIYS